MLLTLTTTLAPATDLGYLLHKHPDRVQAFPLAFGTAHVFFPEASDARCTAALYLELNPARLAREHAPAGPAGLPGGQLDVRPYAASSLLCSALAEVFRTAMTGRCVDRPALAERAMPLTAHLAVVPCRGGEPLLRALFEPLGYAVAAAPIELDARFPAWGHGSLFTVTLEHTLRLKDLLTHLCVLVPVLVDQPHAWLDDSASNRLLRRGAGWLADHPARRLITSRHTRRQARPDAADPADSALERAVPGDAGLRAAGVTEAKLEALTTEGGIGLPQLRQNAICAALQRAEARRVVEFGCGEGKLLERLLGEPWVQAVVGVDARPPALHKAARRLERLPGGMQPDGRLRLLQGDATYADARLVGCDAAVLAEVVEHLTPDRLARAAAAVFGRLRPRTVVVSTPDRAYNAAWPELAPGALRHPDHRFEWTRAEFGAWAAAVAEGYGYRAALGAIGPAAPTAPGLDASRQSEACAPTQMAVFERMS